ncbi:MULTISPECIES: fumarylacetoacetate hydrolase family protein [unclassified Streptomyces]|uniref:fumarylacetoacetate hydrolase family protein n=1 Tax=unclassified Streptomyces TaxID=2593676 RepID=UPI002034B843|nr:MULTISPECIES: fumarylacetoacetate hydrolase family protein [unclassified Streptomyces]
MKLRLHPYEIDGRPDVVVEDHDGYRTSVRRLAEASGDPFPADVAELAAGGHVPALVDRFRAHRAAGRPGLDLGEVSLADTLLLTSVPQIWGVGLNFARHASDLETAQPTAGPGSYLRPYSCVIPNGAPIVIPRQSSRVTAEAELGIVLAKDTKNVPADKAFEHILGFTVVLDMTAEDAIRENPRHIPWSKGFDTFCSIGPCLVLRDQERCEDIGGVSIATYRNGSLVARNTVDAMKYDPARLVEYFSAGRTLPAGTVISTGTPGATVIAPGDTVRAEVSGVGVLEHPVEAA